jgi:hypothetical protein
MVRQCARYEHWLGLALTVVLSDGHRGANARQFVQVNLLKDTDLNPSALMV